MVRVVAALFIIGSICVVLFTTLVSKLTQRSTTDIVVQEKLPATNKAYEPVQTIDKLLPLTSSFESDEPFTHVMLHFASNAMRNPENPHDIQAVWDVFAQHMVGAHYYIARDGTVYKFVDESRKAHHAGDGKLAAFPEVTDMMNEYSIGIELAAVGSAEEMKEYFGMDQETYARVPEAAKGYTAAQYSSLAHLLDGICRRYGIAFDRQHIVGHDEYAPEQKPDPGDLFDWTRLGFSS